MALQHIGSAVAFSIDDLFAVKITGEYMDTVMIFIDADPRGFVVKDDDAVAQVQRMIEAAPAGHFFTDAGFSFRLSRIKAVVPSATQGQRRIFFDVKRDEYHSMEVSSSLAQKLVKHL